MHMTCSNHSLKRNIKQSRSRTLSLSVLRDSKVLRPTKVVIQFIGRRTLLQQGVSLAIDGGTTRYSNKLQSSFTVWHRRKDERVELEILRLKRNGECFIALSNMWSAYGTPSFLVGDARMEPEPITRDGELWIRFRCAHGFGKSEKTSLIFELRVGQDLDVTFPDYLVERVQALELGEGNTESE